MLSGRFCFVAYRCVFFRKLKDLMSSRCMQTYSNYIVVLNSNIDPIKIISYVDVICAMVNESMHCFCANI